MKSLLEELQEAELKGATAEEKFAARLASCSDYEFNEVKNFLFSLREQARPHEAAEAAAEARAREHEPHEPSEFEGMSDAEFEEHKQQAYGIEPHVHFTPTLSDAMKLYRKKLGRE
jgi:hypothetical protein